MPIQSYNNKNNSKYGQGDHERTFGSTSNVCCQYDWTLQLIQT